MGINVFKNGKQCKALRAELYFLLSSGCYTGHTFLCSRSSLIALKRTYICSVNLKALISNKVGSNGIIASSIVLSDGYRAATDKTERRHTAYAFIILVACTVRTRNTTTKVFPMTSTNGAVSAILSYKEGAGTR